MASTDLVISASEHQKRIETIRAALKHSGSSALYLTNPTRILYATGFSHITTERPLALVIPKEGPVFAMGPHLEEDHIRLQSEIINEYYSYSDYPGLTHPIRRFVRILEEKGLARKKIATDSASGAAGGWGYRGPSLTELLPRPMVDGRDIVDRLRILKSPQEIRLLNESARWAERAHDILLEHLKPGARDVIAGVRASYEALTRMMKKIGGRYRQLKWGLSPVVVGCRGQVGPESAIPHSVFSKRKIRKGDVLVTEAGVEIGGYTSELERTLVVGSAGSRAKGYFEIMLNAQNAALRAFKAGTRCNTVDSVARKVVEQAGLGSFLRHHVGHGIGIDGHEPPWLDPGETTVMKRGMVFSCEPGLYVPGFAGFRHSDTIEITNSGMNFITKYPRTLEELTI